MSKRKLSRQQAWRVEKIQEERAKRSAKRGAEAERGIEHRVPVGHVHAQQFGRREQRRRPQRVGVGPVVEVGVL